MRSISSAQPVVGAAALTPQQHVSNDPQAFLRRARTADGRSLVSFWRRCWRSL
jgi:hypothetical protein